MFKLGSSSLIFARNHPCVHIPQHERQLDPTIIVLIPYDLTRLWLYVSGIAFVSLLTATHNQRQNNVVSLVGMTLCTWFAYIVYGASPSENLWHTLAAALYLMLLIQWDIPLLADERRSSMSSSASSSLSVLERLSLAATTGAAGRPSQASSFSSSKSAVDRIAVLQTQAVVGCTVVFHILRLYDRGWQPQRWPVPTILGATVGWIAGLWLGLLAVEARARSARRPFLDDKGDQ